MAEVTTQRQRSAANRCFPPPHGKPRCSGGLNDVAPSATWRRGQIATATPESRRAHMRPLGFVRWLCVYCRSK